MFIFVVDKDNNPLMPTKIQRAKRWIESGRATPFYHKGLRCIRLNNEPSGRILQKIAIGIDPGSKMEGYTAKSKANTYYNLQSEAITDVKKKIATRRGARQSRRYRKTPYRKMRLNRSCLKKCRIPPSTKARWDLKIRILKMFLNVCPIKVAVVEDISAKPKKGKKKWNISFSPLEVGKTYFYNEVRKLTELVTVKGYETKEMRDRLGLKKSKNKLKVRFNTHCVDSWVLANSQVGGDIVNNWHVSFLQPLRFARRQLHRFVPNKNGERPRYGGTVSLGLKRGSFVKCNGDVMYVGGSSNGCISLHDVVTKVRLGQNYSVSDLKFITRRSWLISN